MVYIYTATELEYTDMSIAFKNRNSQKKIEILYCTNYTLLSTHWHSSEEHLKL